MIIGWLFDDNLLINKQKTKLFIWWSSLISLSDKKQTNKQKTNKAYHLVIIFWSLDDHLLSENKQTNKAYHLLIICDHLLIIWWLSIDNSDSDHLLILWQIQTNKQTKLIICGLSDDYLMIIYYLTTNKQTKRII